MNNASIAVIIPVLNAESTLRRCLDSILNQTYINFEVLIQDGGSSDKTKEIIHDYVCEDKRIRYFNFKDSGIYDAMNKLIPHVKSKWTIFLGSDDYLYNNEVFSDFIRLACKDYNVFYGNVFIDGNTMWSSSTVKYDGEFDLKKLLKRNICHQSIFYRTSLFISSSIPYNTNYFISADWDWNLKLWAKEKFCYIDLIVTRFSAGGLSSGTKIDKAFKADFVTNILKYFGWRVLLYYYFRIIKHYFKSKFKIFR